MRLSHPIALLIIAICCVQSRAEDPLPDIARLQSSPVLRHLKKNPITFTPSTPAEQTVSQFYVPVGFRVDLVLSEPDLHQPIAFTFDERGRIWVAEAYSYPTKRAPGEGEDKIVIFEDKDGDGKFETRKVFADKLNLVSGFEVGYGGVWIGAAPELLFIPDLNHDDVPDRAPQTLLDGFGYQDTHECLNSFLWGPDGWLYGIQGVFNLAHIGKPGAADNERTELRAGVWRYHPVRHEFEVFAHGGSNPWGLDYDEHGQLFMTHCRSYWGRGGATHVIQGAEFWNQANANYAPYILADPPREFPDLQNYLLASARHDHGAGGAGARGTDAVYGGHSHVGTMIYYGDNWPDEFRGQMFTHNLGGHQINRDINKLLGSGYETVHAENDMLFNTDPKYVAVDLQYGPDGAVYFIDWYDQQHCHNPNTERWDRSNGRLYRMVWDKTYKPRKTDLTKASLNDLVRLQLSRNAWHARTAVRLINEHFNRDKIDPSKSAPTDESVNEVMQGQTQLAELAEKNPELRLRYLWVARAANLLGDGARLDNEDEFVRAWAIQFAVEQRNASEFTLKRIVEMAANDKSPVVRRYLASAMQRIPESAAWQIAEALVERDDDDDRNIPKLLFQSIAQRMTNEPNIKRALAIANKGTMYQISQWIYWYASTLEGPGLNEVLTKGLLGFDDHLRYTLSAVAHALSTRANVSEPEAWRTWGPRLYAYHDPRVVRLAERIGAAFGDRSRFPQLRATLASSNSEVGRKHAFDVLSRAQDAESLPTFIALLDDKTFRSPTIPQLARYDSPKISEALIQRFANLSGEERAAALNVLTARPAYALALLDAVAVNKIPRDQLSAFHVRQLTQLNNSEVEKRVAAVWGRFTKTSDEKKSQVDRMEKTFNEAPLWAYSGSTGREHFKKLCAQCHKLGEDGVLFGPDLTGSARHGIRYFLENIIDPNAVVGSDFQMTVVQTQEGETISGLLSGETDSTITVRTQTEKLALARNRIAKRELSEKSIMPEGLLDTLQPREQLELLKYLTAK
ncbi:MAG TPA: PVC-type heme-binding CxxCH protein [Verrucomicrobiae bacterium]|nr:PVC-type heme-binding CxxCH protein [Verrucomicrobiae bacterium]